MYKTKHPNTLWKCHSHKDTNIQRNKNKTKNYKNKIKKPQKQKSDNMHSISKQLEFQKNKATLDGLKWKIKNKFFGNL